MDKKNKRTKVKSDTAPDSLGNRVSNTDLPPSFTDKTDVFADDIAESFDIIPDFRGGNFV